MRRWLPFAIVSIITVGLTLLLSRKLGPAPALGDFLAPHTGFWQNAEAGLPVATGKLSIQGLQAPVRIQYDERLVPHIFAQNDHDLYYAQGYVTAQLRLFQMDFQTRAAAGRLSEFIGENPGIQRFDLNQRRVGMVYAAEIAEKEMRKDPATAAIVDAFSEGVNAYIQTLSPREYPIEYKLMGFAPEAWSPFRSAMLLKLMAADLSLFSTDWEQSIAWQVFGKAVTDQLYPLYAPYQDPIIPPATKWDFGSQPIPARPAQDGLMASQALSPGSDFVLPQANPANGSNNWVIGGEKSATGYPILANDPHLGLRLPSVWLEMHLNAPGLNVYGVTLPGSPSIIIGFNQQVAWGVTNVGSDVLDWYQITFEDTTTYARYKYGTGWRETTKRIETVGVRDGKPILDTVVYTHYGPLPYLREKGHPRRYQAMRWVAYEPGNELKTFAGLNRASNYADYEEALKTYVCPAQNFIFADHEKTIALWVNGQFPLKWPGQGKFVLDGADPQNDWQGWIPRDQVPHAKNPERGFLSSANQQSAAPDYPYYLDWDQESWERGARINNRLTAMQNATVDSLQSIQNDNFNLLAQKVLPYLLDSLPTEPTEKKSSPKISAPNQPSTGKTTPDGIARNQGGIVAVTDQPRVWTTTLAGDQAGALKELRAWDLKNDAASMGATVFDLWWRLLERSIWKDEFRGTKNAMYPERDVTALLLTTQPNAPWYDDKLTPATETLAQILQRSFTETVDSLTKLHGPMGTSWQWAAHKATHIGYLLPLAPFKAFGRYNLLVGGGKGIVNATTSDHGPSWRMIVAIGPDGPDAYGIYPGGQSGNPGSKYYDNFVDVWTKGELAKLRFTAQPLTEGLLGEMELSSN